MEEQLITFETVKLAEKKGFNIIKSDDKFYDFSGKLEYTFQGYQESVERYERISAPTQSLLQKWLRDVHNIDVWAQPFVKNPMQGENSNLPDESYSYFLYQDGVWVKDDVNFLDWEEALEHGLIEALKLI